MQELIKWIKGLFRRTKKEIRTALGHEHSHAREISRRKRQIEKGQLTVSNGLKVN